MKMFMIYVMASKVLEQFHPMTFDWNIPNVPFCHFLRCNIVSDKWIFTKDFCILVTIFESIYFWKWDISMSRSCTWGQWDRLPKNRKVPFKSGHMVSLSIHHNIKIKMDGVTFLSLRPWIFTGSLGYLAHNLSFLTIKTE